MRPEGAPRIQAEEHDPLPGMGVRLPVQYVDTASFADYRSVYYKGDRVIKVVDKDWVSMGLRDTARSVRRVLVRPIPRHPRREPVRRADGLTPRNVGVDPSLWTEEGLTRITTQAPAQVRVSAAEKARVDRGEAARGGPRSRACTRRVPPGGLGVSKRGSGPRKPAGPPRRADRDDTMTRSCRRRLAGSRARGPFRRPRRVRDPGDPGGPEHPGDPEAR